MFRINFTAPLGLCLLSVLSSCGSLSAWKQEITQGSSWSDSWTSAPQAVQTQVPSRNWNQSVLSVHPAALSEARDRWPWVQGSQLQRRAQILQMGPDFRALQSLDTSSDTSNEIRILRELMQQRQQFASSSY